MRLTSSEIRLALKVALRYLFSKKSHSAINNVTLISVIGIAVASMAMICTMAVFNGFGDLVSMQFTTFDPDLRVSPVQGKSFPLADFPYDQLQALEGVELTSPVIEENVLVRSGDKQMPARLKGVNLDYGHIASLGNNILLGKFQLNDSVADYANVGANLAMNLSLSPSFVYPFEVYAPIRGVSISLTNPTSSFNNGYLYTTSIFSLGQPQYDDRMMIVPIEFVRRLFGYEDQVTSIELKVKGNVHSVQERVKKLLGDRFLVENRHEQQRELYRMMKIEKWMAFAILLFVLIITSFNIISSLSMLIIEKRSDSETLSHMGASEKLRTAIFLFEGWLISGVGSIAGLLFGVLLCLGQQTFGWLKLGPGFLVEAYPIRLEMLDLGLVLVTVLVIGFLTCLVPIVSFYREIKR